MRMKHSEEVQAVSEGLGLLQIPLSVAKLHHDMPDGTTSQ
jgi:hypothetical protein